MKTQIEINPETIPQGAYVTPREPCLIGRMKARPGQRFWGTDSSYTRQSRQCVCVARKGNSAGQAVALTFADFMRFFESHE